MSITRNSLLPSGDVGLALVPVVEDWCATRSPAAADPGRTREVLDFGSTSMIAMPSLRRAFDRRLQHLSESRTWSHIAIA